MTTSEGPAATRCERCGRVLGRGQCERYCASDTVNGYTGEVDCMETALELARARLVEVERERGDLRAELSRERIHAKDCARVLPLIDAAIGANR